LEVSRQERPTKRRRGRRAGKGGAENSSTLGAAPTQEKACLNYRKRQTIRGNDLRPTVAWARPEGTGKKRELALVQGSEVEKKTDKLDFKTKWPATLKETELDSSGEKLAAGKALSPGFWFLR